MILSILQNFLLKDVYIKSFFNENLNSFELSHANSCTNIILVISVIYYSVLALNFYEYSCYIACLEQFPIASSFSAILLTISMNSPALFVSISVQLSDS